MNRSVADSPLRGSAPHVAPAAPRHARLAPRRRPRSGRRRAVARAFTTLASILLMSAGATILLGTLIAPTAVERGYGEAKTAVQDAMQDVVQQVTATLPSVTLGVEGGQTELDWCDGTFTRQLSYEQGFYEVPPVWAAHNHCGGDVILGWQVGDLVQLAGSDAVYEIIDVRLTAKHWVTTEALDGLQGELALQSCFYGIDQMKFVGLQKIADSTAQLTPAQLAGDTRQ